MKRIIFFILILLLSLTLNGCNTTNIYQTYIDTGLLESANINFNIINNSSFFIKKYNLNQDEISNIGSWHIDTCVNKNYIKNGGLGINVSFFPNRIFRAYKDYAKVNNTQYIFGEWKIEKKKLMIKLNTKAVILADSDWYFESLPNEKFYIIMNINKYYYAAINREPYNFSNIPQKEKDFFEINDQDLPRSRLLFDTLGNPPGDLSKNSKYDLIFSTFSFNNEYLKQLIKVW